MRILGKYALVYLLDGDGTYRDADGRKCAVRPGDLILLFPELAHCYGPEDGGVWSEIYLVFSGPVFDLWHRAGMLLSDFPVAHLEPVAFWQKQLESVVPKSTSSGDQLSAICRLQCLLADAQRASGDAAEREPKWFQRAKLLLSDDGSSAVGLPSIASQLGLSYESFRKEFARRAGQPPSQFRLAQRIRRASAMLYELELSNRQIADRLGFSDEFHFAKAFKKVTGMTPRTFRLSVPR